MKIPLGVNKKIKSLRDKGFFYLLSAMLLGQGISFTQRILLGRWLTREDFGRYSLIVESNIFFTTLITLALPMAMIRFGLKEKRLDFFFAGAVRIFLFYSILLITIYFALRQEFQFFNDQTTQNLVDLAVLCSPFLAIFNYTVAYLSAQKRIAERAVITLLQRVTSFLFIVGGCWLAFFSGAVTGFYSSLVAFGLVLGIRYRKMIIRRISGFPYGKLIEFSFWSSLSIVSINLSFFIILNFSERILDDLSLISQLSIAFTFTIIAKIFFASVNDLLFPYFMEKETRSDLLQLVIKVLILFLILSAVILLISYGIIPFVISFLLGEKYLAAIPIFKLAVVGEILVGFSLMFEIILEVFGAVKFKAVAMGLNLLVLLLILRPLIVNYGVYGAIYSFLIFALLRAILNLIGSSYCLFSFSKFHSY
ncbi:oligosaccharide flippase family protein [bacterium]|nr:oligosaccharide flippase family protein [bacterium]